MLYLKSVNTDVHSFTLDLHNGTDVKLNFKQNDHIARILQTTFTSHDDYVDLTNAVLNTPPGTTVTLTVQRQGVDEYQPIELDVELRKMK